MSNLLSICISIFHPTIWLILHLQIFFSSPLFLPRDFPNMKIAEYSFPSTFFPNYLSDRECISSKFLFLSTDRSARTQTWTILFQFTCPHSTSSIQQIALEKLPIPSKHSLLIAPSRHLELRLIQRTTNNHLLKHAATPTAIPPARSTNSVITVRFIDTYLQYVPRLHAYRNTQIYLPYYRTISTDFSYRYQLQVLLIFHPSVLISSLYSYGLELERTLACKLVRICIAMCTAVQGEGRVTKMQRWKKSLVPFLCSNDNFLTLRLRSAHLSSF